MAAAEQLRLDISFQSPVILPEVDLADAMIAAYGGDARQAVRELMLDADFLRDQLQMAVLCMGRGYTRGWKPRFERLT